MSSPSRTSASTAAGLLLLSALALGGCKRNSEAYNHLPSAESGPTNVSVSTLYPGGGSEPPQDPRGKIYEGDPHYITEGKRLYNWYNCVGCHFNGAGGIGPSLMDSQWTYGGRIDQIYATIYQGRPNGMPHWGSKIPDAQIWEIAAYVRSLSAAPNEAGSAQAMPKPPPTPKSAPPATPASAVLLGPGSPGDSTPSIVP